MIYKSTTSIFIYRYFLINTALRRVLFKMNVQINMFTSDIEWCWYESHERKFTFSFDGVWVHLEYEIGHDKKKNVYMVKVWCSPDLHVCWSEFYLNIWLVLFTYKMLFSLLQQGVVTAPGGLLVSSVPPYFITNRS